MVLCRDQKNGDRKENNYGNTFSPVPVKEQGRKRERIHSGKEEAERKERIREEDWKVGKHVYLFKGTASNRGRKNSGILFGKI